MINYNVWQQIMVNLIKHNHCVNMDSHVAHKKKFYLLQCMINNKNLSMWKEQSVLSVFMESKKVVTGLGCVTHDTVNKMIKK